MSENPYESPPSGSPPCGNPPVMTWGKGILIVASTTFVGAIGGTAIGMLLGLFLPGYYRSVFGGGNVSGFDPVAVGIGQGLTQGIAFGASVGLGLVAAIAVFKARQRNP